jgi:fumarylacetoacetase
VKLGVFLREGEPHVGRIEDDVVVDLGLGESVLDVAQGQSLGDGPTRPVSEVQWLLPFPVADYVDFYASRAHVENMGRILRPGQEPLPAAWLHLPIGYHGRAGTVVVSGTEIRRPHGQRAAGDFGPTRKLDVEVELGFVIGKPAHGPVPIEQALDHVFGVVLVNDWSARDIQAFEYVPLGPLLGKSFATSISPWVTTLDELERVPGEQQDPEPLPHLRNEPFAYDLPLELELNGAVISHPNARHLYWNIAQQIAHLTSNGATLRRGDLLASGTISGPGELERGSLIELTSNQGPFLADGDVVVLRGAPLGPVSGRIVP